jgi:ribosomal protein S18 acetylase RimI-like enzyme
MIRLFRPRIDKTEIIRLIRSELIPLSHTVSPRDAVSIRELAVRLRSGVTYVSAAGKSSPPAGFIHLLVVDKVLQIDMLAIHPKQRGLHLGVRLMKQGEAYGLSKNCSMARLLVDEGNDRAHRFYARLGYQTIRFHHQFRCYELIKPLASRPN